MKAMEGFEPTESQIRAAIFSALEVAIRPYKGFIWPIETGGRDRKNRRVVRGQTGAPDLFMIYRGMPVAIEVKKPKTGVQSEKQKEFQANMEAAGGTYKIVHSVEEALEMLKDLSVLEFTLREVEG